MKVLVEAHGSRVTFIHPHGGEIYSRPSPSGKLEMFGR
jgi:hypothetical protein